MDVRLGWGALTHPGSVRQVNQDATLAGPRVFAVADGMGGHAAGEVASSIAVAALAEVGGSDSIRPVDIVSALEEANRRISRRAAGDASLAGMGTTVAGIGVSTGAAARVLVFNVGDSRVYRLRRGVLDQLSVDHSVVAELVAAGQLDPREVSEHPDRHTITRALGLEDELTIEQRLEEPIDGDRYLICSDGLTNELADQTLREALRGSGDARVVAQDLLERALACSAIDNVSIIVVDVVAVSTVPAHDVDDSTAPAAASDATVPPRQVSASEEPT